MPERSGSRTAGSQRVPASLYATAVAGTLATVTMDGAMLAAGLAGGDAFSSQRLGPQMIGRWAHGLARGRFLPGDISHDPPVPHELALGMATHYVTGIALTATYLLISGRSTRSLPAATAFGVATSVFPLLVMFPSMGYGPCGLRSGEAARMIRIMLIGHVAFGAGIGVWTRRFVTR